MRIELDGLTVEVETNGVQRQPWRSGGDAFGYRVTVEAAEGTRYETAAYGSQHAFESGGVPEDASREIGMMVLDELQSAAYDPDEFWAMALDPAEGAPDRKRVEGVMDMLETAAAMVEAIDRNADALDDYRNRF